MGLGIVSVGAVFVDIKGHPYGHYIPAGRNVGRVIEVHGGVSRNVAEDIARVGLRPTFVSVVDRTGTSTSVIERLNESGCNTDYIVRCDDGLGTWLAVFDHTGDVVASISKRPDLSEIAAILDREGDAIFSRADSICVEMDIEAHILERIFELARRHAKQVFSPVTNMSVAVQQRSLLMQADCIVCNQQEASILFSEDFGGASPDELRAAIARKVADEDITQMVVTMGPKGSVFAVRGGESGTCPAQPVDVIDTTGAGDSFFSGVAIGLTYGKSLAESCEIGSRLAASVIVSEENVCAHFTPADFGLDVAMG